MKGIGKGLTEEEGERKGRREEREGEGKGKGGSEDEGERKGRRE
jgi:hypothetical protein